MSISTAAGGVWGGLAAAVLVPFVSTEGVFIGAFWGLICAFVPVLLILRKSLAVAVPLWLGATTVILLVTLPFDNLLFSFAGSTAAYIVACYALGQWLMDELPPGPDRSRCASCGYSREGLSTDICPECGNRFPL